MKPLVLFVAFLGLALTAAGAARPAEPPRPRPAAGLGSPPPAARGKTRDARAVRLRQALRRAPLSIEANRGQTDSRVRFLAQGRRAAVFFTPQEAVLTLAGPPANARGMGSSDPEHAGTRSVVRMQLVGARPDPQVRGVDPLPGKMNYFLGQDPRRWQRNVPTYARVRYEQVYPGVDLVYYGNEQRLEYDFILAPGAAPEQVRVAFQGVERARLDARGDLALSTVAGEIRQPRPVCYQVKQGRKVPVEGRFVLSSPAPSLSHRPVQVGFRVAAYDRTRPLVIDPQLVYSTYFGGPDLDFCDGVDVDQDGSAYLSGSTFGAVFPSTPGAFTTPPSPDNARVFVAKLNPAGNSLVYCSVFGGKVHGYFPGSATSLALNPDGTVWVAGRTDDVDFPTTPGSLQPKHPGIAAGGNGTLEGFLCKLSANGSQLLYSTYFGGWGDTLVTDVASGLGGRAFITGATAARDDPNTRVNEGIPVSASAPQRTSAGGMDAFAASFDPNGVFLYSTYLGGATADWGYAIAVDVTGVAYVTGVTDSVDDPRTTNKNEGFPTTPSALQTHYGGQNDAFLTLVPALGIAVPGQGWLYSTYLGGSGPENSGGALFSGNQFDASVAVDGAGNAYLTGKTESDNFPTTPGSLRPNRPGGSDAFVTKIRPIPSLGAAQLVYSTYLGGGQVPGYTDEVGYDITVDLQGNAYVVGLATSSNFPQVHPLPDPTNTATAFASVLNSTGSALLFSSRVCGSCDGAKSIALGLFGEIYLAGYTFSDPPGWQITTGAYQPTRAGGSDAFLIRIRPSDPSQADLALQVQDSPDPAAVGQDLSYTLTVTNNGPTLAKGVTVLDTLPAGVPLISSTPAPTGAQGGALTFSLGDLPSGGHTDLTLVVRPPVAGTLTSQASVSDSELDRDPTNNYVATQTTVVVPTVRPDLTGAWSRLRQTVSGAGAKRRVTLQGEFVARNAGRATAAKTTVRFALSTDQALDAGDRVLKVATLPSLRSKQSRRLALNVRLPRGVATKGRFVLAALDPDNHVAEADESNNQVGFGPLRR